MARQIVYMHVKKTVCRNAVILYEISVLGHIKYGISFLNVIVAVADFTFTHQSQNEVSISVTVFKRAVLSHCYYYMKAYQKVFLIVINISLASINTLLLWQFSSTV